MIEEERRSGDETVQFLDTVRKETSADGEVLEVITDHVSEFDTNKRDQHGGADHAFETYLAENDIEHNLC